MFGNLLETLMVARMDQHEAIVARFMNDAEFQKAIAAGLATKAYESYAARETLTKASCTSRKGKLLVDAICLRLRT